MSKRRYYAEPIAIPCEYEGIPFTIAARLIFDKEAKCVLAVRSLFVLNADGQRVEKRIDFGMLTDVEYGALKP